MRTFTIVCSALLLGASAQAQTVATFDDLSLSKADTFYVNLSASGSDVGFNDGLAHFPCVYDTSGGYTVWNYFAYSNMTDSVTSGYTNQYAAKTGIGYGGSGNYAVAYCVNPVTFGDSMNLRLNGAALGEPVSGFYITNSTYAFNSMYYGDSATGGGPGKKFGGATGNDPDWFLLTVKGYAAGILSLDSVNFYLADYRFTNNDSDYVIRTWQWVNLLPLGNVDSLQFYLSSSDTGIYGMNTPAYFCMDNFTTHESSASVAQLASTSIAKVYPNPATNMLYVDLSVNSVEQVTVIDMAGHTISTYSAASSHIEINTAPLPAGTYLLQLSGNSKTATTKFIKD